MSPARGHGHKPSRTDVKPKLRVTRLLVSLVVGAVSVFVAAGIYLSRGKPPGAPPPDNAGIVVWFWTGLFWSLAVGCFLGVWGPDANPGPGGETGGLIVGFMGLVMGAGVAGLMAIGTARRLGAVVEAFDVRPVVKEQVESLGGIFIEVPMSEEEKAAAQTAGGYAREMNEDDTAAGALFGLGTVAYSRGEYTPSIGFYREAFALYEKRDDKPSLGRALVSLGQAERGMVDDPFATFDEWSSEADARAYADL